MKKCPGCEKEIDKYTIACQYCGKLLKAGKAKEKREAARDPGSPNMNDDPLSRSKEQYESIIARIYSPDSSVGIDAQYTHAVIITYLQQITRRLDALEERLKLK